MATITRRLGNFEETIGQGVSIRTVAINAAKNTTAVLLAAPGANKQIWVLSLDALCLAIGSLTFKDSGGGALSGLYTVAANQVIHWETTPNANIPWLVVGTNLGLSVTLSTNTDLDGVMTYAVVDVKD